MRTLSLSLALVLGSALPALLPAQDFSGTYATRGAGGEVVLTLSRNAGGYGGTLVGNGSTFRLQGTLVGQYLTGTISGDATLYFAAELSAQGLSLALIEPDASGQPDLNRAQRFEFSRQGAGGPTGDAPGGAGAAGAAQAQTPGNAPGRGDSAAQQQMTQLLTSSAWCSFSYNQHTGTSSTTRNAFSPDGRLVIGSGGETYSSGTGGTVAGQHSGGQQAFWRVTPQGQLELSLDRATWAPAPTQVRRNSGGYPIIVVNGTEYSRCN